MKHRLRYNSSYFLFVAIVLSFHRAEAAEVVVHAEVVERTISRNVARLIFTMRLLRWQDRSEVKVFVLPDSHPLHREFAKRVLELYPRQLRRVWDRLLFSGGSTVPIQVSSVDEMRRRIADTPGAIGYLPPGVETEGVRVVDVE